MCIYIYVLPANKHSQNLAALFLSLEIEEATVAFNYCLQTNEEFIPVYIARYNVHCVPFKNNKMSLCVTEISITECSRTDYYSLSLSLSRTCR